MENFGFVLGGEDEPRARSILFEGYRRLGGSLSWKIDLDTTGVVAGTPSIALDYSFFAINTPLKHGFKYSYQNDQPSDIMIFSLRSSKQVF